MGILDGFQFDPQSYSPQGILGMLAQAGVNLPMNTQPPQGFPQQPPTDMSAVNRNGTSGVTLPQMGASGFGRDGGGGNPLASLFGGIGDAMGGLGNAVGGLFGPGGQQAAPSLPGAQQAPQAPHGPGMLDRLSAGAGNFTTGGNPLAGLINSIKGFSTGERTDPAGLMQQNVLSTYHALVSAGVPPGVAQAAAVNPKVLETIAPQLYSKPVAEKLKDALGNERIVFANPDTRTVTEPGGAAGGQSTTEPNILAPGVKSYDPTLSADEYMAQFSPDMQAAIKSYMNGDVMPTGNPRQMGMANAAKGFAQLYGQKAGIPVSDQTYAEKRKLRTDLAASSNNSMGGILSNGASSFSHLAELSDSFANLGNYAGPNIPGGGHIGDAGNYIGNALFPRPETKGKLQAVSDNALKYGQESTKFYAGSGGGEGERMMALNQTAGPGTNAEVQAAFLDKEKSLMLDRLRTKFAQIRDVLGDEEAAKVIARKSPDIEKNIAKIDANIARLRGQAPPAGAANAAPQEHAQPAPLPAPDKDGWIVLPNGIKIREKK